MGRLQTQGNCIASRSFHSIQTVTSHIVTVHSSCIFTRWNLPVQFQSYSPRWKATVETNKTWSGFLTHSILMRNALAARDSACASGHGEKLRPQLRQAGNVGLIDTLNYSGVIGRDKAMEW